MRGFDDLQAIALGLGPDERLRPVNPGTTQLHLVAGELGTEGTAAKAIARLQQQCLVTVLATVTSCGDASESAADDHHVVIATCGLAAVLFSGHGICHNPCARHHNRTGPGAAQETTTTDALGAVFFIGHRPTPLLSLFLK
ncbi:hypothetical protein D3C81_1429620 [compost metagenome]